MRALAAIICAILASCGIPTPEDRGIEVDYSIFKVYNQDKAMFLFEKMVEDELNVKFNDKFNDTTVYWSTLICPYSDEPAVVYQSVCYHGRMWSCREMYVAMPKTGKTCGSALIHEYAHCLTMEMSGSGWGDPGHQGKIWAIVADASKIACDRGW